MTSEITQQLISQLLERDARGLAKYGVTLDRKDLTTADWAQHMVEELLDAAGYALAVKREHDAIMVRFKDGALVVEPVAWLCVSPDGVQVDATARAMTMDDYARFGRTITPLYAFAEQKVIQSVGGTDRDEYLRGRRVGIELARNQVAEVIRHRGNQGDYTMLARELDSALNSELPGEREG